MTKITIQGYYKQGRHLKIKFEVSPKSAGRDAPNLLEAYIWERGTGTFQYKAVLTGEKDLLYVHRLSGMLEHMNSSNVFKALQSKKYK